MSDIVLFRHHTHYEILAANIIEHERRKFAEEMEADWRRINREKASQSKHRGVNNDE